MAAVEDYDLESPWVTKATRLTQGGMPTVMPGIMAEEMAGRLKRKLNHGSLGGRRSHF